MFVDITDSDRIFAQQGTGVEIQFIAKNKVYEHVKLLICNIEILPSEIRNNLYIFNICLGLEPREYLCQIISDFDCKEILKRFYLTVTP